MLLGLLLLSGLFHINADVVSNPDGTYTIDGTWTFWAEKEMLAPSGRENTFGDFNGILFKSAVNDFPGLRDYKKTYAKFVVRGRISETGGGERMLVVEEIVELLEGGIDAPSNTP